MSNLDYWIIPFLKFGIWDHRTALQGLTSSAWENLLWRFGSNSRIRHFHVAMIKGIIYTNLAISVIPCTGYMPPTVSTQRNTRIPQELTKIPKLAYVIPFIIATWK